MTSFTTNKNLTKPGHNEDVDTWDVPVNGNSDIIDACLGNTSVFNMTGVTTKTLIPADYQATTLKFIGTLGSGVIPILLPNGVSGEFTIIDATTPTDASSQLGFGWVTGGTGVILNQGATQWLTADGANLIWAVAAPQTNIGDVAYLSLTGIPSGDLVITDDKARFKTWVISGTAVNGILTISFPKSGAGTYTFINQFSAAGGSTNVRLGVEGAFSQSVLGISPNTKLIAAYFINSGAEPTANWLFADISTPI